MGLRILHTVEFYSPSVGGSQEVVRRVSEALVRRGHEVTVATTRLAKRTSATLNGVRIAEFDVDGNAVRGMRGEVDRYRSFVVEGEFDVVMSYAAQQWATDALAPVLGSIRAATVLAPCGFSGLRDPAYAGYFRELPAVLDRYDHLIFHSETYQDIEFARRHGLSRISVVPNAADPLEFEQADGGFRRRHGIPDGVPLLLTVGTHTGIKGHRLVLDALRKLRVERAVLALVGNGTGCLGDCRRRAFLARFASRGRKYAVLLDPPRPEVAAAFVAADVFAFGSAIECSPLVLFEAMAAGTPFVSIGSGNAAEIAEWTGGGIVVPSKRLRDGRFVARPKDLATALDDLLADDGRRRELADAGRAAVRRRFNWNAVAAEYERVYRAALERRAAA